MYLEKKCVSEPGCLLQYPAFSPGERCGGKERRAVRRMNAFYEVLAKESRAYASAAIAAHPRAFFTLQTTWRLENTPDSEKSTGETGRVPKEPTEKSGKTGADKKNPSSAAPVTQALDADKAGQAVEKNALPLDAVLTVTVSLALRDRPEPTRRRTLVHRWQNGLLLRPAPERKRPGIRCKSRKHAPPPPHGGEKRNFDTDESAGRRQKAPSRLKRWRHL